MNCNNKFIVTDWHLFCDRSRKQHIW